MSLFTKTDYLPKLSDVIFTDGRVLNFDISGDFLKIVFLDYAESEIEIIFYGVTHFKGTREMSFDIADYKLKHKEQKILELCDDEDNCVFYIKFRDTEVNFVKSTQ